MKTIKIKSIEKEGNSVIARVVIDDNDEIIRTTFTEEYSNDIVTDRIDAYVWGLIGFAMSIGADIVSDIPISESLYYNLAYHYIPTVVTERQELKHINIIAPLIKNIESTGRIVATGISCGVDSLYTIKKHTADDIPPAHRVNTLVFLNVGSSMKGSSILRTPLVQGRLELAKRFVNEYKYDFLFIESDIHLLINKYIGYDHVKNHTFMMLFSMYHLQSVVGGYYYSSGYSYGEFHFSEDTASFDLFTFAMASIGKMHFYSTGGENRRLDKTKELVDYPPAYKYLNVCVEEVKNDAKCFKCVRTMLTLDGLKALDKFGDVFDVDYYKKNRFLYLKELYVRAVHKNDPFMKEILPFFKKEITIFTKIKIYLMCIKNRLFGRYINGRK